MALDEMQKREFLAYARRELRKDPIALEQPIADSYRDGQMIPFRAGTNLETALLICSTAGAFPYTNLHSVWRQIVEAHDELSETARVWSPLTKAFQSLDFRFLDNVDPRFAQVVRDDGRLQSFRSLLQKIGNGPADITEISSLDGFVRDCNDELAGEYQKAQAEWSKIDESFLKWILAALLQLRPSLWGIWCRMWQPFPEPPYRRLHGSAYGTSGSGNSEG